MNEIISKRQYTGLHDKNGVDICNGDIVLFPYYTPFGEETDDDGEMYVVEFKYGCFGFQTKTKFLPLIGFIHCDIGEYISNHGNVIIYKDLKCKVIGNVDDNYELNKSVQQDADQGCW